MFWSLLITAVIFFAVAGTQSSGDKLKMEMAQEGFSAAYVPGVKIRKCTFEVIIIV